MSYYNGFSYEEFYEFVIDFFEADATPEGQEASANLLEWWNKYVHSFISPLLLLTRSIPERCSRGLQPHVQPNPRQHDEHRLRSCGNNVRLLARLTHPRSSFIILVTSIHPTSILLSTTTCCYRIREPRDLDAPCIRMDSSLPGVHEPQYMVLLFLQSHTVGSGAP